MVVSQNMVSLCRQSPANVTALDNPVVRDTTNVVRGRFLLFLLQGSKSVSVLMARQTAEMDDIPGPRGPTYAIRPDTVGSWDRHQPDGIYLSLSRSHPPPSMGSAPGLTRPPEETVLTGGQRECPQSPCCQACTKTAIITAQLRHAPLSTPNPPLPSESVSLTWRTFR